MIISEHDYIKDLITDRWWAEVESRVHPLQYQVRSLLHKGRYKEVYELEEQIKQLTQQLMNECIAAEDRLHWLELDAALRQEGKTYPNVYEQPIRRADGDEF